MEENEFKEIDCGIEPTSPVEEDGGIVELSMHAINGSLGSGTLKLKGRLRNMPILILLDTGSTTTFLSSRLVEELSMDVVPITGMKISLANGSKVTYDQMCYEIPWEMGGSTFKFDFRVLDLGTYDLMLGTDWM